MEIPFVGGAYLDRSTNLNAQRCVNLYPVLDKEEGKVPIALYGTPGLKSFANIGVTSPVRGMIVAGSFLYAVCGSGFYRIDTSGTVTSRGTLDSSSGYCWMAYNGTTGNQIMIVDGTTGYIYNTSTTTFAKITDANFPGASSLTFQDGYFIVSRPDTGQFYISASYDGTNWDASDYATAEGHPDNLMAVVSDHRELWLFGEETTEVWYNSGNATFPFERKIDEILERGLGAVASVVQMDNTIFWLDNHRMVQRAEGYRPHIISTRQIEYQFASYSTVSDAIGFSYVQDGHSFYILTFPIANKTWVYDAATNFWHERSSYPNDGRWRANYYVYFDNKRLIGDHSNGKIYELDLDTYTDDGEEIKAKRTTQVIHKDRKNLFFHKLEIDFESGVGIATGQGNDPQAMLKWSDDGGHTWSNEHWRSMGKIGEYTKRAIWRRLGKSRERIFDLTISDPVKRVILAADADITVGTA
jgi:hypothetical protein